ncbi:MAG: hypothetical protein LBG99_04470 [Propionibacteriaceae bacterium]|jgi:glycerate kinase|nr:hypothetical protein [Propionibacteriaceae bacterium]
MQILLVYTPTAIHLIDNVLQGFKDRGANLVAVELPKVAEQDFENQLEGHNLLIYVTTEVEGFSAPDPRLITITRKATDHLIPVILITSQCRISTRELRTWGIEAAYEITSPQEAQKVAQTWVAKLPRHDS